MLQKHDFPVAVQRWIINQRLVKDNETLSRCGVNTTGSVIYLYLKSIVEEVEANSKSTQTDFLPGVNVNQMNNITTYQQHIVAPTNGYIQGPQYPQSKLSSL